MMGEAENLTISMTAQQNALNSKVKRLKRESEEKRKEAEEQVILIIKLEFDVVITTAAKDKIFDMNSQQWEDAQSNIAIDSNRYIRNTDKEKYIELELSFLAKDLNEIGRK